MRDINVVFEKAVRRDPANWFWVHDRWRFVKQKHAAGHLLAPQAMAKRV
jgi:KDO2-lipid IV(A) lauroyltransferase